MKKNLLIFIFSVISCVGYGQYYVATTASGSGDGSDWDNAAATVDLAAAAGQTIYMKEGTYPAASLTLPSGNTIIKGGYPADLTGTILCGQDPTSSPTVLQGSGNNNSYFTGNASSGNMSVEGITYTGQGLFLRLNSKNGGTYTFNEVIFTGTSDGIAGSGIVYLDGSDNNTVTFNKLTSQNNGTTTFSTQNNTEGNSVTFTNSYITDNDLTNRAGAIFLEGDNSDAPNSGTIDNTTFCTNKSNGAGAILIDIGATLTITNSKFYNNEDKLGTVDNAGAIYATGQSTVSSSNNVYSGNKSAINGGAINLDENSTLTSTDDVFTGNTAGLDDDGGAIYATGAGGVTINGSEFSGNTMTGTSGDGGAIYVDGTPLNISGDAKFIGNTATGNGGAIFISGNSPTTISNAIEFSGNTASGDGGAIDITGNNLTIPSGSTFIGNTAGDEGGAIWASGLTLTSAGVKYSGNTATGGNGGAIFATNTTLSSTGDSFITNKGSSGGAVHVDNIPNNLAGQDIQFINSMFYDNEATGGDGGALDLVGTASATAEILVQNSDFLSNTSSGSGGAIKSQGGDIHVDGSRFESNSGTYGGAIKTEGNVSLWVNAAAGASWFKNNTAREDGGAIEVNGDEFVVWGTGYRHTIDNTTFYGNTSGSATNNADSGGGALSFINVSNTTGNPSISITNSNFYNNATTVYNLSTVDGGGAIFTRSDIANFDNNNFAGNTVNGSSTSSNSGAGGSDIRTYFASISDVSNSAMQLATEGAYTGDVSFDTGNTFSNTATSDPGSLTAPTAPTASTATTALDACPAKNPEQTTIGNPKADPTLSTSCGTTATIIMNTLNDQGEMDNAYTYTWTAPDGTTKLVTDATANAEGDFTLSDITETGTYTLEFTDSKGCEVTETIEVTVANCTALPVQLISFTAQTDKNNVLLTWKTKSEINNDYFSIERSIDGVAFSPIGKVIGAGDSSVDQAYDYTDENVDGIVDGLYYRLKQVDYDGGHAYSDAIYVSIRTADVVTKLYPNPAGQGGLITVQAAAVHNVKIYDITGKLIKSIVGNGSKAMSFETDDLARGIYIVKINNTQTEKLTLK